MKYLPILFVALFWQGCSPKPSSDAESSEEVPEEVEMAEETTQPEADEEEILVALSAADSTTLNGMLSELKGIDKFFVVDSYYRLQAILAQKEDPRAEEVAQLLEGIETDEPTLYFIEKYQPKDGYLSYTPGPVEVFIEMVYWNVTDGSQLIGYQALSCGPVCDVELSFNSYRNGVYESLPVEEVLSASQADMSEKLAPGYMEDDEPYEFVFQFPLQGKDLKYCLEEECLVLAWNDGTFTLQE
ncbi:MAG: hypothetical protein AAFQ98_14260 [Bacteroidota bacterium]